MRVLTNSLSGVAVARNRMDRRGWWLCSIAVAVLLAGLARPAHAAKQFVYVSRASCQPDGLIFAVSPLTYTNYGVVYEGLNTVDVVCPITWAKPTVPTGQIVGELDIQVDWLSPGQTPSCSLGYWGPAGTFRDAGLANSVPGTDSHDQYESRDARLHPAVLSGHWGDFLQRVLNEHD